MKGPSAGDREASGAAASRALCTTALLGAPRASLTSVTAVSGSPAASAADARSGVAEKRADADVAGRRGSGQWAPRHPGGGSDQPPRRCPLLPFPPLRGPPRPAPRPSPPTAAPRGPALARPPARSPAAPVALRGPQAGGRCSARLPPPRPQFPLGEGQNFRG